MAAGWFIVCNAPAILPAACATCASRLATMAGRIATAAVCRSMTFVATGCVVERACISRRVALELETQITRLGAPGIEQRAPVHISLCLSRPQRC